jgi:glycosyltransferase involved in cell wall biosynthesis
VECALTVTRHVIVVDDGSTDGAPDAVRDYPIRIERFPVNRGKGAAILAGFRAALSDISIACIVIVDADGQHDAHEVPALYEVFRAQEADLVIGTRNVASRSVPWASRLGNIATAKLFSVLFGEGISDTQSGFRLHGRGFAEDILETMPAGRYETEMAILVKAASSGYRIVSTPIATIYQPGNATSHFRKFRDSYRVWRTLFIAWLQSRRRQPPT